MRKQSTMTSPLRTLFSIGSIGNLSDGQLLERFATGRGEAAELAFAALVERHGPMVFRVCRSVLADRHDAEDAFQATFLVLVKKARGLWVNDSLGAWLHQVAFRTASSALKEAIRRQRHERRAAEQAASGSGEDDGARHEMENLLHAEIDRLPERYRVPVVLCDLEGRSHEQAARYLGWPIGTVKSRLARGRDRLHERLQRGGLFSGGEFVAVALRPIALDQSVPVALVQSTTFAAVRFGASQTIASASAAALAQGVLNAMSMTRWVKVAAVLLVSGATVSGGGLLSRMAASGIEPGTQKTAQAKAYSAVPVAEVKLGAFKVTVAGPGTVEAVQRSSLVSRVEIPTTILTLVQEGKRVKKGDMVCELGSAALRDQLTNQKITTDAAEDSARIAAAGRENAETAVKECTEGTYPLEKAKVEGEIKLAESAIQRARAQADRIRRVQERLKNAVGKEGIGEPGKMLAELSLENQLDTAEQTLMDEQLHLSQAQSKLRVLEDYTKGRMLKELRAQLIERRMAQQARDRAARVERDKRKSLELQIEHCKLFALQEGVVAYARDPSRPGSPTQIEEGATVRKNQIILRIEDIDGPMQVNAKMPEAMVDREKIGQKVIIKVDAFPDETFTGEVVDIAPLPDPTSFFNVNIKVYTTHIRFTQASPGLRPGLSAKVEIFLAEHDNALTVPIGTVVQLDGTYRVALKKADGSFDWREVTLGDGSESAVEIKQGLRTGEQVAMDPLKLLSEDERGRATTQSPWLKTILDDQARAQQIRQKMINLDTGERAKLKNASPAERAAILKKAGFSDTELKELKKMEERVKQFRRPH